jgi:hypothetical protein
MAEDGQGPERDLSSFALVIPPQVLRKHLGMTQSEFAKALRLFSTADGGLQALPRGGHQRRPPGQFGTVGAGLLLEYGERRWFEAHIAENRRKQLSLEGGCRNHLTAHRNSLFPAEKHQKKAFIVEVFNFRGIEFDPGR